MMLKLSDSLSKLSPNGRLNLTNWMHGGHLKVYCLQFMFVCLGSISCASDSFTIMALYKSTYLLTYLTVERFWLKICTEMGVCLPDTAFRILVAIATGVPPGEPKMLIHPFVLSTEWLSPVDNISHLLCWQHLWYDPEVEQEVDQLFIAVVIFRGRHIVSVLHRLTCSAFVGQSDSEWLIYTHATHEL